MTDSVEKKETGKNSEEGKLVNLIQDMENDINSSGIPEDGKTRAIEIIKRIMLGGTLGLISDNALEYINWLKKYPWDNRVNTIHAIEEIRSSLKKQFWGHDDIIEAILDYEVMSFFFGKESHPLRLLFVGPSGTGKSYIAKAIAKAINRNYSLINLGGVANATWIKGIPRHYHGSQPGRIVRGIIETQQSNPVLILDEIDKVGHSTENGSPALSLLEVIDPDNYLFEDLYFELPVNLKETIIIALANSYDNIHPSLLNRFKVFDFEGYKTDEKFQIAKEYLWPQIVSSLGMNPGGILIDEKTLMSIILKQDEEQGVRKLKQLLTELVLKVLRKIYNEMNYKTTSDKGEIQKILDDYKYKITNKNFAFLTNYIY